MSLLSIILIPLLTVVLYVVITAFLLRNAVDSQHLKLKQFLMLRFFGTSLFAISTFVLVMLCDDKVTLINVGVFNSWWAVVSLIVLVPVILMINYNLAKNKKHHQIYPQLSVGEWRFSLLLLNALLWGVYLFAYELFFRGVVLSISIKWMGIVVAIAFNSIIYAIAHLPKGKFEVVGSMPLGVIFCVIAYLSDSFLIVWILHFTMAVSNDFFCIKNKVNTNSNEV
ncbi:CPBP family intramembrane glutamic endopeptidase [Carboxylicivirga marina]|uniref:CPBP family intramembrane metalloprotease n=1 Tax=Carboxylicivirga marina TaxID=2800988 RepID=A0ABS1HNE0_9BACT|nr:CPBP family intramembrane glutamic endopeptidase [Carboxylicivirga marina]MBK3519197.1 CPBP family intramembrane metalloprotease [Carboxylicivirga marina]